MALEQENQRLLGNLQQVTMEKQQQDEELTQQVRQYEERVQQLEMVLASSQQQAVETQGNFKQPKISQLKHPECYGHVKIRTRDLLCYNRVLCVNQHVQYTIICIIDPCNFELAS